MERERPNNRIGEKKRFTQALVVAFGLLFGDSAVAAQPKSDNGVEVISRTEALKPESAPFEFLSRLVEQSFHSNYMHFDDAGNIIWDKQTAEALLEPITAIVHLRTGKTHTDVSVGYTFSPDFNSTNTVNAEAPDVTAEKLKAKLQQVFAGELETFYSFYADLENNSEEIFPSGNLSRRGEVTSAKIIGMASPETKAVDSVRTSDQSSAGKPDNQLYGNVELAKNRADHTRQSLVEMLRGHVLKEVETEGQVKGFTPHEFDQLVDCANQLGIKVPPKFAKDAAAYKVFEVVQRANAATLKNEVVNKILQDKRKVEVELEFQHGPTKRKAFPVPIVELAALFAVARFFERRSRNQQQENE